MSNTVEASEEVIAALRLFGLKVKDKVTGFRGVVVHVGFDLYGCVSALVLPEVDKDNKGDESKWYDVKRLIVETHTPVMALPEFLTVPGPEQKPLPPRAY